MMKGCVKQAPLACTTSNLLHHFQVCLCLQTWMPMQRSCSILVRTLETIFLGQATRSLLRSCKTIRTQASSAPNILSWVLAKELCCLHFCLAPMLSP